MLEKILNELRNTDNHLTYGGIPFKNPVIEVQDAIEIVQKVAKEYGKATNVLSNGWIPCSEKMPPEPTENPEFEYKPLELYLVSLEGTKYPFRAIWNGHDFTNGWSKVDAVAWQPLPAPYQKGE